MNSLMLFIIGCLLIAIGTMAQHPRTQDPKLNSLQGCVRTAVNADEARNCIRRFEGHPKGHSK